MASPDTILPLAAAVLATITALHLSISVIWFARQRGDYSHRRHTISELGEVGAPHARAVAWGSFAPTGLFFCASLLALRACLPRGGDISQGVLFFGLVGVGYLLSAVFPCDAGAPPFGSVRNQVHNFIGGIDYLGALGGLDVLRRSLEDVAGWTHLAAASRIAFVAVLVGFIGTVYPNPVRGLMQRVGEVAIFGWLVLAGWTALTVA